MGIEICKSCFHSIDLDYNTNGEYIEDEKGQLEYYCENCLIEKEIEDNCVLDKHELLNLENMVSWMMHHGDEDALKPLKGILLKINRLNDMAKELRSRNLSVKTIVKFHDIGRNNMVKEKQK